METRTISFEGVDYVFQHDAQAMRYIHRTENGKHLVVINHAGAVWLDGEIQGVGRDAEDAMEIGITVMLNKAKTKGGDTENET